MDKGWIPIGLCLALAGVAAFSSVYVRIKSPKSIDGRLPARAKGRGPQIFYQQVISAALILIVWVAGGFAPLEFGVSATVSPYAAFGIGFAIYFVVLAVVELSAISFGVRDQLHDLSFETMRFIWPRERMHKPLALAAVCILNPFTEEVIYRGVLVFYLGQHTGNIFVAVLIGLILSLLAHGYQGIWLTPFHVLFHGTAIAILYTPLGLFGCFGMHFAGDLVPVVMLRRSMLEWKARRKVKKAESQKY